MSSKPPKKTSKKKPVLTKKDKNSVENADKALEFVSKEENEEIYEGLLDKNVKVVVLAHKMIATGNVVKYGDKEGPEYKPRSDQVPEIMIKGPYNAKIRINALDLIHMVSEVRANSDIFAQMLEDDKATYKASKEVKVDDY